MNINLRKSLKVNAELLPFCSYHRRAILTYIPAKNVAINPHALRCIISKGIHMGGLSRCSIPQEAHTLKYKKGKTTITEDIH